MESGIVAVPLHEAIGVQRRWVFVDCGLLLKGEGEHVAGLFRLRQGRSDAVELLLGGAVARHGGEGGQQVL